MTTLPSPHRSVPRSRAAGAASRRTRAAVAVLALGLLLVAGCGGSDPAREAAAGNGGAEATAQLRSLPYGRWVPVAEGEVAEGVVHHEPERAWSGRNLFNPRHLTRAFLLDMEGREEHQWSLRGEERDGFHHVEPTPDGGLVALIKNRRLLRLGADSRLVWSTDLPVHHDVAFTPEGHLWVPTRYRRWVTVNGEEMPIFDDHLTLLDADGRKLRELPLWEVFGDRVSPQRWQRIRRWREEMEDPSREAVFWRIGADTPADVFHTNSVEPLGRRVPGLGEADDLLVSVREIDTVAVVDPRTGAVKWSWGPGEIEQQHHPSLTPEGNVLLFDNGRRRRWSRVVEVDPRRNALVWEYRAAPRQDFFSASRGSAQRLANGNTLITESDAGRVFEVTPQGEVVWDFLAPLRRNAEGEVRRSAVYRLRRMPPDWPPGGFPGGAGGAADP